MSEVRKNKDKFVVRLEDGLRDLAYKKSAAVGVSMNTLLNRCIDKGLNGPLSELFSGASEAEPVGDCVQLKWTPTVGALVEYDWLNHTFRGVIIEFTLDVKGNIMAYIDDVDPNGLRRNAIPLNALRPVVVTYNGN